MAPSFICVGRRVVSLGVEETLERIEGWMEKHEQRHEAECAENRRKFEKLFDAAQQGMTHDATHKARLNGIDKEQGDQDTAIEKLGNKFDEFRVWLGRWFLGIAVSFVLLLIGVICNLVIMLNKTGGG